MEIALAQINTDPGCIEKNTEKIIGIIDQAREKGAELVVFPELSIPGYMSLDLMLYPDFVKKNLAALRKIVCHSKDMMVILGFIDQGKDLGPDGTLRRYNSAAVIRDGELIAVQDKTLLPDYDVFFENRYFQRARDRKLVEYKGLKIGIEICEDLWDEHYPIKVSQDLINHGADLLINLSASPFYIGKRLVRENLIRKLARKYQVPFVYTNTVGGQDGYDGELVFDGQSLAFDKNGNLIAQGEAFKEELLVFNLEKCQPVSPNLLQPTHELHDALTFGIKEYFRRSGFKKALIGLSGGIDSAVVAALAVEALGKENVTGVSMPSKFSSSGSVDDAQELANNLGIDFKIVPIKDIHSSLEQTLSQEFKGLSPDVTEENMQARSRGIILMALSNKFNSLVLSTGNKTETALGYTTLYGDMCGGLAVISDVNKLRVYDLANFINQKAGREVIPQNTITKPPSAELRSDQTDEQSLGSYDIVSPLVDELVEDGKLPYQLYSKYPQESVDKLFRLIQINEYKRRQAPPGIKVTPKAFGIGRRIPMSHQFKGGENE